MPENKTNFFFPIIDTWPDYFENPHEGLGTVYERFLLHRFFDRLKQDYAVRSVLEVPSFGMTGVSGVNSLWWARQGIVPVVMDNDLLRLQKVREVWRHLHLQARFVYDRDFATLPFADGAFDLSFNFASLWFVPHLIPFLNELSRVTAKAIFISVPNRFGIGYQLRLHWPGTVRPALKYEHVKARAFVPHLRKLGWQLADKGYFDIPPWPDFPLKKEVLLQRLGLRFILKILKQNGNESNQRVSILDYFSGVRPHLDREVLKYGFLEKAPWPVRALWAHHRYYLFVKD